MANHSAAASHSVDLTGKAALVTGGASGIGEAIAKSFLDANASVVVVDIPDTELSTAYSAYSTSGRVELIEQDITQSEAPRLLTDATINRFGQLDILVNNAGLAIGSNLETTTDALWDQIMGVNVTAMFRLSRAALPHLKKSAAGRIINLGSIMSDMAGPNLFVYGTSKHAVAGMTKSMAVDLGQYGITANYIQPGAIVTALSAPFFEDEAFRSYWEEKAPVGRLGQPDDVAAAALFLASDAAQFISGVGLNVDGGAIVKF